jgi:hypothetical protein
LTAERLRERTAIQSLDDLRLINAGIAADSSSAQYLEA